MSAARAGTSVIVTDAAGAARADRAAIESGIPSRALMQRAGAAAAAEIVMRFTPRVSRGVLVVTGAGNNGGDGWVIARALHATGIRVRVVEVAEPRTPDARAERALALADAIVHTQDIATLAHAGEQIVVDALLGTGFRSGEPPAGRLADALGAMRALAESGAAVVAIDIPSGMDASDGTHAGAPRCALTVTFGTVKRGLLVAREHAGHIVLVDIGLGTHTSAAGGAVLATTPWFRATVPPIAADAHKGTRRKIAILGGAEGMAGAVILAARGALRSGAGMVRCIVAPESLGAVQQAEPAALAAPWPESHAECVERITSWADALLIGPGLGAARARDMVELALSSFPGPLVLDADALNAFTNDADALGPLVTNRQALLTPHPAELGRLAGLSVEDVLAQRFVLPHVVAHRTRATVLSKGAPTVVSAPNGASMIIAEGNAILGTGGSGDVLGGIAVTLLAQGGDALTAGALAAFAHGRAASTVSTRHVRGYTLDDVLAALPSVWTTHAPLPRPPVLAELPALGDAG